MEEYYTKRVYAAGYYNTVLEGFGIDDAAIEAYYNEHKENYDMVEYYAFDVKYEEGGEAKAKADAEALLAKMAADGSNFDATIQDYEGSDVVYAGGYKEVAVSSVASAVKTWLEEAGRKAGDKAVVEDTANKAYTVVVYLGSHLNDEYTVSVRHTLLTTEEIGTYTSETEAQEIEARNAQVKAEAEALYTEWVNGGASEEAFIQMAKDHSEDGNASTGGLYSGVYMGQMVEAFQDWCFDASRTAGDTGIVETEYGFHVMYFVGDSETNYRDYLIRNQLKSEDLDAWYTGLVDAMVLTAGNTDYMPKDMVLAAG